MKKILFMASAGLLLASCANDEVIKMTSENEITFAPTVANSTRAGDVYCSNNFSNEEFYVWGVTDNKLYFSADHITKNGSKWENSTKRYWPSNEVTFYAAKGESDLTVDAAAGTAKVENFTVETDVTKQRDLIYAVAKQTFNSESDDNQVKLNFRHALAMVVFKAQNENPNLHVVIDKVEVGNVYTKGTYTLPTVATGSTLTDHSMGDNNKTDVTDNSRGSWSCQSTDKGTFSVSFEEVDVEYTTEAVDLTAANDAGKEYSSEALLLIPSESDYTKPTNQATATSKSDLNGSYFLVYAKIYNVAGSKVNKETDVMLWGDDKTEAGKVLTKAILIPADLTWKEGQKYVYTFKFGNGGAGYDPENPDKPVLNGITYDCTVDDFIYGDSRDEEAEFNKKEETPAE